MTILYLLFGLFTFALLFALTAVVEESERRD